MMQEWSQGKAKILQFASQNQRMMKKGRAPFALPSEHAGKHVGKRGRFEIHHKQEIQHGGAVMDVDNLSILTPKRHVDIHRK